MNDDLQEFHEHVAQYQDWINSGTAWRLEGAVGREAMRLIEDGYCVLGEVGHNDFYGNYVPSRHEVRDGTKGSMSYARDLQPEFHDAD